MKAGSITVDLSAGNAKFITDIETAKAKLREFGSVGVSEHKAVAAAVKAFEGNMFSSARAADAFIEKFTGLAPILAAAFPIVGALAFIGVIGEAAKKVQEFFKELKDGPEKAAGAFRTLANSMQTTNDSLVLDIVKLNNETAKLEGKHENGLALMLAEARVQADKLGDSVLKDIENIQKLLKEQEVGFVGRLFSGDGDNKETQKFFGGDSGFGGIKGRIQTLQLLSTQASTPAEYKQINEQLEGALQDAKEFLQTQLKPVLEHTPDRRGVPGGGPSQDVFVPRSANDLEKTNANIRAIDQALAHLHLEVEHGAAVTTNAAAKAAHANESLTKPFEDKIRELKAQFESLQAISKGIGGTEAQQITAQAIASTDKQIAALKNQKGAITDLEGQTKKLLDANILISRQEHENASNTKFKEVIDNINERITAEHNLAAAIGASFQAQRQAAIDTEVAKVTKGHVGDADWLAAHQNQINEAGAKGGQLFDDKNLTETNKTLLAITNQIELEQQLAAVQSLGAEAVRRAELEQRIIDATRGKAVEEATRLEAAERKLYEVSRLNAANAAITKANQEAGNALRVGQASFGGADAARQAALANSYVEAARAGATATELEALAAKDWEEHQAKINQEAAQLVTHYADALKHLQDMKAALQANETIDKGSIAYKQAIRDIDIQELQVLRDQTLQLGTASSQVKAFFQNMQIEAKKTSTIIYDSLNSAIDKLSDQFSKLLTGQKTNFAQMFKTMGQDFEKSAIKTGLTKGLGALGEHFGIKGAGDLFGGKKDGSTESKALWVKMAGGASNGFGGIGRVGQVTDDNGNPLSKFGSDTNGFTGSGMLGSLLKLGLIPGLAGGGDTNPYSSYIVGEHAPELFTPRTAGTVTPMNKLGSNVTNNYIDARHADLGAANRIARTMDMIHSSAIKNSVRATHERSLRTPQRSGR